MRVLLYFWILFSSLSTIAKNNDVIIIFKSGANLSKARILPTKEAKGDFVYTTLQKQADIQRDVISLLQRDKIFFEPLWIVNALRVVADEQWLKNLEGHNEIIRIIPNTVFVTSPQPDLVQYKILDELEVKATTWGINKINADSVWALGIMGQGVVVGGQDTGYDFDHPALINQYRGNDNGIIDHNYNWHDAIHTPIPATAGNSNPCGFDSNVPCDDHSHGTHTMGTCLGRDSVNDKNIGVAPKAQWIGCRNMDRGNGLLSTYLECFQFFLAPTDTNGANPDPSKAPHVINNSWACPNSEGCDTSNFVLMESAIQVLIDAGIVVVVSNGNEGSNCKSTVDPPAIFTQSFSVGATDYNDALASFSSRGPVTFNGEIYTKPDISAPGVGISSCVPGTGYASYNGTSMAGPHVAGLVALIISANPDLAGDVTQIKEIITSTAKKLYSTQGCGGDDATTYPNNSFGYGRIDALAAVNEALHRKSTPVNISQSLVSNTLVNDYLFFKHPIINSNIYIFDSKGSLLKEFVNHDSYSVDLSSLNAGFYFVRVWYGSQWVVQKIFKN